MLFDIISVHLFNELMLCHQLSEMRLSQFDLFKAVTSSQFQVGPVQETVCGAGSLLQIKTLRISVVEMLTGENRIEKLAVTKQMFT